MTSHGGPNDEQDVLKDGPKTSLPAIEDDKSKELKEKWKKAMTNGVKAHGEFDRRRRDWQALLNSADKNTNTKESKPVYKLYDIIDELTECDTYFEVIEADWKTQQSLSEAQYDDIVGFCTTAFQLIKDGNKVATAVSACMRL